MSGAYSKKIKLKPFDKYDYYQKSVQSPDVDVEFLRDVYQEIRGKKPISMREDFCGTHLLCCEWVKLHRSFEAYGVDLDPEPIEYGMMHSQSQLSNHQRSRVHIVQNNVLSKKLPRADIIVAQNFSYFIFKTRKLLLKYLKRVHSTLENQGIAVLDCFGGSQCMGAIEEETAHKDFSYFWDQEFFDPITNHGLFYIHFKRKGEKKRERVFTYDWRMWSIPEIREMMDEAGFSKTYVYWEGTDRNGDGDGKFVQVETGEECESWVAYVVGER